MLPAAGTVCPELVPLSTLQWVAGDCPPTGPTLNIPTCWCSPAQGSGPTLLTLPLESGTPSSGLDPLAAWASKPLPMLPGIGSACRLGRGPQGQQPSSACPGVGWGHSPSLHLQGGIVALTCSVRCPSCAPVTSTDAGTCALGGTGAGRTVAPGRQGDSGVVPEAGPPPRTALTRTGKAGARQPLLALWEGDRAQPVSRVWSLRRGQPRGQQAMAHGHPLADDTWQPPRGPKSSTKGRAQVILGTSLLHT